MFRRLTAQLCERPVVSSEKSVFKEYLDRQGRNEYINLASQIGYDGHNIAFVFYENQIRKLMSESPCNECRLEILRASCAGQPREMVNLFLAPMKSLSTSERIEKALDRLRQRYGVSGGLTTEPEIIDIRHGSKVVFNVSSLKSFNEDLNTLEVFAYAHDEVEKLSGQLLLDVASRLPGVLKRRYLDYLARMKLSLNRPGFDSLRNFIVHELSVMTSDYAQTFFKHDEKDTSKSSENGRRRGFARVRQVAVTSGMGQTKSLPLCFICSGSNSRHFIGDCKLFKSFSNECKKRSVIDAGRCLNCLALGHVARNCSFPSKCRKCGPKAGNKHATVLHESYGKTSYAKTISVDVWAAEAEPENENRSQGDAEGNGQSERDRVTVRKLIPATNNVLLRTSAVRVINPRTGKSTLVYAQNDTASQVTLISKRLKDELLKLTAILV